MMKNLYRYPGAQPFRDDEFSRRTFFGRELASAALTDQILANRLVIVFAKSGLGKTSLLNAGVAPRLREAGSLPLFVRVNDIQHGPSFSVLEGMKAEAERQQVEYVSGDSSSLWALFKTAEFWRGDLLLTPVLILDQFEELFTLQSQEAREQFLSELGYLIRGIRPPSQPQIELDVSEAPPPIRVVLSLREDFLGLLEEASDHIPEIMDHRYRVAPLNYEMASKAITGPAAIEHRDIATRVFHLEPEAVTSILSYLNKSTAGVSGSAGQHIEPFHLQLICQRIERIAAFKQQTSSEEIVLSSKDLGGEAALAETLESFYMDAILSLPGRHLRGAVRILCEQFLISPEGRRLSVEERELRRQLKLPGETLSHLVERRLLRTDRRSDSTYYELSHDALVQPVLASRRMQALVVGWASVIGGSIVVFSAAVFIAIFAYTAMRKPDLDDIIGFSFLTFLLAGVGAIGVIWMRAGNRRRRRYRRHTASEFTRPLPTLLPLRQRIPGWIMLATGFSLFTIWGLVGLYSLCLFATVYFMHSAPPGWFSSMKVDVHAIRLLIHDHPFVETLWLVIEYSAVTVFGWLLFRQGARKLWPHKFTSRSKPLPVPGVDQAPSLILASVKAFAGGVALVLAVLGLFALRVCSSSWHGTLPYWISWPIISYRLSDACQVLYQKSWNWSGASFAVFFVSAVALSIALLRNGVLELRTALLHRRLAWSEREQKRAMIVAAASGIIVASLLFWTVSRLPFGPRTGRAHNLGTQVVMADPQPVPSQLGWAVGTNATVLHTEDGGTTWKEQSHGTGWLYSVNFPRRDSGWAVGQGGTIWHTEDGGATWKSQTSGTKVDLSVITFATPLSGWAVGAEGTILHTEDAGNTWKQQPVDTKEAINAVTFITRRSGWAVGTDGTILHTEDGGVTWKPQKSGTTEPLNFVAFATPQSGWATGSDGTILRTEDGVTWRLQNSKTIEDLTGIAFVTPSSAWVVGEKGTILHTEDSGETWRPQQSGIRADIYEISFATPQSGWAAGHSGIILHTEDGGRTWTPQNSGTRTDLQSVTFIRPYGVIGIALKGAPNPAGARIHVVSRGVTVASVVPDGPADKAGLKVNDIIVAVNGKQVRTPDEMVTEISTLTPGTNAMLDYVRDSKETTVPVIVANGLKPLASRAGH
jgi:photosystem II stability/assembly factor-like uncharacterized protein